MKSPQVRNVHLYHVIKKNVCPIVLITFTKNTPENKLNKMQLRIHERQKTDKPKLPEIKGL